MRQGYFLAVLCVLGVVWGSRVEAGPTIHLPHALAGATWDRQGKPLSTKPFQDARGNPVTIHHWKRLTLLKIWGTFCGPCVQEIPGLQALRTAFPEKDLMIVPLCIDSSDPAHLRTFLNSRGGHGLPVFSDARMGFVKTLGIVGVPVSVLVDEEGRELWRKTGGPTDWSDPEILAHFRALLKS